MSLYALLAELVRLCLIALDALWITALAQAFGAVPHRMGPWVAFALIGGLMVAVQRLPRWYGYDKDTVTRLAALLVALLPLSRLMAVYAPTLVEGGLAGPPEWLAAFVGVWGYSGHFPLTVIATAGLLLWWRSGRIAHSDVSQSIVERRSKWAIAAVIFILLWNSLVGTHFTPWLAAALGATVLMAMALARLRFTVANPTLAAQRPAMPRLIALLGLSTVGTLLASAIVGVIVRDVVAPLLAMILRPIGAAVGQFLGAILERVLALLGPIEPGSLPMPPTPTPELVGGVGEVAAAPPPVLGTPGLPPFPYATILLIALVVLLMFILLRWNQRRRAALRFDEDASLAGSSGSFRDWLRDRFAQRPGASRPSRLSFGTDTVRDLYANLLLFGDAHGLPRPLDDTPYEYLEPLVARYPARRADLVALTDAYVSLRYGEQRFAPAQVGALREALRRIEQGSAEA